METIVYSKFFIFVIVAGIGIFVGLDLKKWAGWSYGIYGFLSGLFFGLVDS